MMSFSASGSASRLFHAPPTIQPAATASHLESQIQCCLALKSAKEYHMWLFTYVRYLVNEGETFLDFDYV